MATTLSKRSIASWKPHWFASNLHMSCTLLSLVKIKYNRIISWKRSVWVWKTKARLSNQNNKVLKCYNFSHTTMTAASICFKSTYKLGISIFCWTSINLFEKNLCWVLRTKAITLASGWQSSERSIFSITKTTLICFKFTHELHNIIFYWIQVYRILWKKSVLSWVWRTKRLITLLSKWQSSERSIFSNTKTTPICFKFTHERHNIIFCWIQV